MSAPSSSSTQQQTHLPGSPVTYSPGPFPPAQIQAAEAPSSNGSSPLQASSPTDTQRPIAPSSAVPQHLVQRSASEVQVGGVQNPPTPSNGIQRRRSEVVVVPGGGGGVAYTLPPHLTAATSNEDLAGVDDNSLLPLQASSSATAFPIPPTESGGGANQLDFIAANSYHSVDAAGAAMIPMARSTTMSPGNAPSPQNGDETDDVLLQEIIAGSVTPATVRSPRNALGRRPSLYFPPTGVAAGGGGGNNNNSSPHHYNTAVLHGRRVHISPTGYHLPAFSDSEVEDSDTCSETYTTNQSSMRSSVTSIKMAFPGYYLPNEDDDQSLLSHLPDEVLRLIFDTHFSVKNHFVLRMVSKRFNAIICSNCCLWRRFLPNYYRGIYYKTENCTLVVRGPRAISRRHLLAPENFLDQEKAAAKRKDGDEATTNNGEQRETPGDVASSHFNLASRGNDVLSTGEGRNTPQDREEVMSQYGGGPFTSNAGSPTGSIINGENGSSAQHSTHVIVYCFKGCAYRAWKEEMTLLKEKERRKTQRQDLRGVCARACLRFFVSEDLSHSVSACIASIGVLLILVALFLLGSPFYSDASITTGSDKASEGGQVLNITDIAQADGTISASVTLAPTIQQILSSNQDNKTINEILHYPKLRYHGLGDDITPGFVNSAPLTLILCGLVLTIPVAAFALSESEETTTIRKIIVTLLYIAVFVGIFLRFGLNHNHHRHFTIVFGKTTYEKITMAKRDLSNSLLQLDSQWLSQYFLSTTGAATLTARPSVEQVCNNVVQYAIGSQPSDSSVEDIHFYSSIGIAILVFIAAAYESKVVFENTYDEVAHVGEPLGPGLIIQRFINSYGIRAWIINRKFLIGVNGFVSCLWLPLVAIFILLVSVEMDKDPLDIREAILVKYTAAAKAHCIEQNTKLFTVNDESEVARVNTTSWTNFIPPNPPQAKSFEDLIDNLIVGDELHTPFRSSYVTLTLALALLSLKFIFIHTIFQKKLGFRYCGFNTILILHVMSFIVGAAFCISSALPSYYVSTYPSATVVPSSFDSLKLVSTNTPYSTSGAWTATLTSLAGAALTFMLMGVWSNLLGGKNNYYKRKLIKSAEYILEPVGVTRIGGAEAGAVDLNAPMVESSPVVSRGPSRRGSQVNTNDATAAAVAVAGGGTNTATA